MAGTHDLLKARFAFVRHDLTQILDRLTEEELRWTLAPGMRTVAGQLLEIADKEREVLVWIQTGMWPDGEPPTFDEETADLKTIRMALDRLRAETYAFMDSLSVEELEVTVSCPENWWEALRLRECPRSEVLRNVAMHEWYHYGQLVTYFWARGHDPYSA